MNKCWIAFAFLMLAMGCEEERKTYLYRNWINISNDTKPKFVDIFSFELDVDSLKPTFLDTSVRELNEEKFNYNEIFDFVLNDLTNFRTVLADNASKPRPIKVLMDRYSKTWHRDRFFVSLNDSLELKHDSERNFKCSYNIRYMLKDNISRIISHAEKKALEKYAKSLDDSLDYSVNGGNKNFVNLENEYENELLVRFSKPLFSSSKKYVFIDYIVYYNDFAATTFDHLYSWNYLIYQATDDGGWAKVKYYDWILM